MMSRGVAERLGAAVILAIYLAVAALYASRVPPYNAPDEPAHVNYVRDLAERGTLPILQVGDWDSALLERLKASHFPPGTDVSMIRYESHQPPLYYLVMAPVARLTIGLGEGAQVVALRLATSAIGAAALLALYFLARTLLPAEAGIRLAAVGLAAFIPMRVAIAASVSNDMLAELMLSLVIWRSAVGLRDGIDDRGAATLGVLAGLGALTKLTCYAGLPIAALAIWFAATRRWRAIAVAAIAFLVLVGPWLARGAMTYGPTDPLGLARHDLVVADQPRMGAPTVDQLAGYGATLFRSFWGQFGWMGVLMDQRIYLALAALSGALALGFLLWVAPWGGLWHDLTRAQRRGLGLAALLLFGVALGTLGYNLTYLQPQGRYLFPAMSGIALFSALAARELIAPRQRAPVFALAGAGLVALDGIALFQFVLPALAV